jgi:F-type H+-transporting ATPase subunit epsilon
MKLQVRILTPDGIIMKRDDIDEVILPTSTGQIAILPQHAALITALEIGLLRIRVENDWTLFIGYGGNATVGKNYVQILLSTIENVPALPLEEVREEAERFRILIGKLTEGKEKLAATQNYKKAAARLQGITFLNSIKN